MKSYMSEKRIIMNGKNKELKDDSIFFPLLYGTLVVHIGAGIAAQQ